MKVLVYCQFHYGLGHLSRAYKFIKHLSIQGVCVDVLVGGLSNPMVEEMNSWPGVECLFIDPLRQDPQSFKYFCPYTGETFENTIKLRCEKIVNIFENKSYDWVFLESFPFSRRRFKPEIDALLSVIKKNKSFSCGVLHRDIGLDGGLTAEVKLQISTDIINWVDKIFIFGDPKFMSFNGDLCHQWPEKIEYVGYLPRFVERKQPVIKNQVCVAIGGGIVGLDKLHSLVPHIKRFSHYKFLISEPPYIDLCGFNDYREKISSFENVRFFNFFKDYEHNLLSSEMSISTCGYNSFLDLVFNSKLPYFMPIESELEQVYRHFCFVSQSPVEYRKVISRGLGSALDRLGEDIGVKIQNYMKRVQLFNAKLFVESIK